jgi:hypothetical protein
MVMAVYNGRALTKQSDGTLKVVPGAHIEVRTEIPGLPLAALKSDRDGATPKSNPFDADTDGKFSFYVVGGAYQIRAYTGSSGSPDTEDFIYHEAIGLNAESDSIAQRSQREVTAAGAVTVDADGADDIIINKTVGEATTVNLPSAALRTKPIRIIDGKGDAYTYNITIAPVSGQKIYAIPDHQAIIDGNGGQLTLTPKEDGSGWY